MSNRQDTTYVQTSLFDDLMAVLNKSGKASSADIGNAIEKLKKARQTAQRREAEARKRQEEQDRQKKKIEEQKKQEARIQQVTSMDLPLDWEKPLKYEREINCYNAQKARLFFCTIIP